MSGFNRLIKNILSKRPGFWFFQIIGWSLLIIYYDTSYRPYMYLYKVPYFWVLAALIGFFFSLLLRKWYRIFYKQRLNIYYITILVTLSSLTVAVIWVIIRAGILTQIEKYFNNGIGSDVDIYADNLSYKIIFWVADKFWPLLVWSTLYFGIKLWQDLDDERERGEKALLLAQTAQLRMLRYQLNPHFLFNSLSSIQALIYDDPKHADLMLTELSDFLRFTLHDKEKLYIPLRDEVVIIQKYLSMEKRRFPDRLNYSVTFTEEAAKQEVVAFILQPFVENAVKYGMRTSPEKLLIDIKGFIHDKKLVLEIMNSGKWIEQGSNEGTGIRNVIERLQNAYTDKFKIFIDKGIDSVIVSIEISIK
ncbi:MAG: histidine kinase [Bacteroidetes bacterium]|nr:histidine kinase [Bacteroidota bacterium]